MEIVIASSVALSAPCVSSTVAEPIRRAGRVTVVLVDAVATAGLSLRWSAARVCLPAPVGGPALEHGRTRVCVAERVRPLQDRQTARKGTILDRKTVETQQKDSALHLTCHTVPTSICAPKGDPQPLLSNASTSGKGHVSSRPVYGGGMHSSRLALPHGQRCAVLLPVIAIDHSHSFGKRRP